MTSLAVVGCGSWGRNLIRVFDDLATVQWCCHTGTTENQEWIQEHFPSVSITTEYRQILQDATIDAVVIATPIHTHYQLAKRALRNGKHVFVEKPLTLSPERADELVRLANEMNTRLFVGYIFVHHPVFHRIYSITDTDSIETIYFDWRKTGGFTENIIANLGSHDLAMMLRLIGSQPSRTHTVHKSFFNNIPNIVSIAVEYEDGPQCRIDLNRLSPVDQKTVTFTTYSGALYVWRDMQLEKFNPTTKSFATVFETDVEPLANECATFLEAVENESKMITDGVFGRDVTVTLADLLDTDDASSNTTPP